GRSLNSHCRFSFRREVSISLVSQGPRHPTPSNRYLPRYPRQVNPFRKVNPSGPNPSGSAGGERGPVNWSGADAAQRGTVRLLEKGEAAAPYLLLLAWHGSDYLGPFGQTSEGVPAEGPAPTITQQNAPRNGDRITAPINAS